MRLRLVGTLFFTLLFFQISWAESLSSKPEVRAFIESMVEKHHFKADELTALFDGAVIQEKIISNIQRPAEAKPWYEYRPNFLGSTQINNGVAFWKKHAKALARAEKEYGVPPEIIIAILGVETRYGTNIGNYRVLDALSTLSFAHPNRAAYFRKELESFLLMARDERLDPATLKGSYAGAMGAPQFMPSSYRHYAVDFSKKGQRDLWNDWDDVIGSVANYFTKNGWHRGEPVAQKTKLASPGLAAQYIATSKSLKPTKTGQDLAAQGIVVPEKYRNTKMILLSLAADPKSREYWLGFHNFYVITQYNRSISYSMAVFQLSKEIRKGYLAQANAKS